MNKIYEITKMCSQEYLFIINKKMNKYFINNKIFFYKNRRKRIDDFLISLSYRNINKFFGGNDEKEFLIIKRKDKFFKKALNYKYLLHIFTYFTKDKYKFYNELHKKGFFKNMSIYDNKKEYKIIEQLSEILNKIFNNKITEKVFLNHLYFENQRDEINDFIFNEKFIEELEKIDKELIINIPINIISIKGFSVYLNNKLNYE